jgi:hypothetical protein
VVTGGKSCGLLGGTLKDVTVPADRAGAPAGNETCSRLENMSGCTFDGRTLTVRMAVVVGVGMWVRMVRGYERVER